jgi:hypothetical protein
MLRVGPFLAADEEALHALSGVDFSGIDVAP